MSSLMGRHQRTLVIGILDGKFPVSGHQPNPTMRQLSQKREMINRVKLLVKVFKDDNGYDTPYCAYGGESLEPEHPRYFILLSGTS